jgi:hypothetical protein
MADRRRQKAHLNPAPLSTRQRLALGLAAFLLPVLLVSAMELSRLLCGFGGHAPMFRKRGVDVRRGSLGGICRTVPCPLDTIGRARKSPDGRNHENRSATRWQPAPAGGGSRVNQLVLMAGRRMVPLTIGLVPSGNLCALGWHLFLRYLAIACWRMSKK